MAHVKLVLPQQGVVGGIGPKEVQADADLRCPRTPHYLFLFGVSNVNQKAAAFRSRTLLHLAERSLV